MQQLPAITASGHTQSSSRPAVCWRTMSPFSLCLRTGTGQMDSNAKTARRPAEVANSCGVSQDTRMKTKNVNIKGVLRQIICCFTPSVEHDDLPASLDPSVVASPLSLQSSSSINADNTCDCGCKGANTSTCTTPAHLPSNMIEEDYYTSSTTSGPQSSSFASSEAASSTNGEALHEGNAKVQQYSAHPSAGAVSAASQEIVAAEARTAAVEACVTAADLKCQEDLRLAREEGDVQEERERVAREEVEVQQSQDFEKTRRAWALYNQQYPFYDEYFQQEQACLQSPMPPELKSLRVEVLRLTRKGSKQTGEKCQTAKAEELRSCAEDEKQHWALAHFHQQNPLDTEHLQKEQPPLAPELQSTLAEALQWACESADKQEEEVRSTLEAEEVQLSLQAKERRAQAHFYKSQFYLQQEQACRQVFSSQAEQPSPFTCSTDAPPSMKLEGNQAEGGTGRSRSMSVWSGKRSVQQLQLAQSKAISELQIASVLGARKSDKPATRCADSTRGRPVQPVHSKCGSVSVCSSVGNGCPGRMTSQRQLAPSSVRSRNTSTITTEMGNGNGNGIKVPARSQVCGHPSSGVVRIAAEGSNPEGGMVCNRPRSVWSGSGAVSQLWFGQASVPSDPPLAKASGVKKSDRSALTQQNSTWGRLAQPKQVASHCSSRVAARGLVPCQRGPAHFSVRPRTESINSGIGQGIGDGAKGAPWSRASGRSSQSRAGIKARKKSSTSAPPAAAPSSLIGFTEYMVKFVSCIATEEAARDFYMWLKTLHDQAPVEEFLSFAEQATTEENFLDWLSDQAAEDFMAFFPTLAEAKDFLHLVAADPINFRTFAAGAGPHTAQDKARLDAKEEESAYFNDPAHDQANANTGEACCGWHSFQLMRRFARLHSKLLHLDDKGESSSFGRPPLPSTWSQTCKAPLPLSHDVPSKIQVDQCATDDEGTDNVDSLLSSCVFASLFQEDQTEEEA